MTVRYIPRYTYEDYKQWEGDWELIDGIPIAMAPSPVSEHQMLLSRLAQALENALEECDECFVLVEEDWIVDSETVVRPDISVVCGKLEDFIRKPPYVIVEIVSSSSAHKDERVKFALYEEEKVEYYVLVYPKECKARIFQLKDGKYDKVGDFLDEEAILEGKCTIRIDFEKVCKKLKRLRKR